VRPNVVLPQFNRTRWPEINPVEAGSIPALMDIPGRECFQAEWTPYSSIFSKQFCPFDVIEDDRVYREPYSFPDWTGRMPVLLPMTESD
jgi:hypothetical protein